MTSVVPEIPYIRRRTEGEQRATFFELFFDLVYVFAVTQLSHHLLAHPTWEGAAETLFMLVAVYWAWTYTTWMTNWFDPDTVAVRIVLVGVMAGSLLMSVGVPEGFGEHDLLFACGYAGLQVARNAFVVGVTPPGAFNRNFRQILAWSVASLPLWIAGGVVDGTGRWTLWLIALGLDLAAPLARYWLPVFGHTPMSQWQIEGAHFAERFQLFVIIALGESIVVAGATASSHELTGRVLTALAFAFLSSTALWWLYFSGIGAAVNQWLSQAPIEQRGRLGRDIYTYLHLPIIAGIVLSAVGDELVIAEPGEKLHAFGALVALGGPALFLLGLISCARRLRRSHRWPLVGAVAVLLLAMPLAAAMEGMWVLVSVTVLLAVLIAVEHGRNDAAPTDIAVT